MTEHTQDRAPLVSCSYAPTRRFRPFGLLLLGAMIVAAILFAMTGQTARADRPPVEELQARTHGAPSPAGFVGLIGGQPFEDMMDNVKASQEQMSRIRDLARAAREDVDRLARAAPSRGRRDDVADAVSQRVLIAMADISSVLTPEQRAQLSAEIGVLRVR